MLLVEETTEAPGQDREDTVTAEGVIAIILAAWTCLANLLLITSILRSEYRRQVSFNLHACNLSLVNMFMGGLVLPLFAVFSLKDQWPYSDTLCKVWIIADLLVCTVSVLVVLMTILDRFILFSCVESAEGACKYVISACLILVPWVLGFAVVLPIYFLGETGEGVHSEIGVCFLHLRSPYAIALELVGFVAPGLAAFGLLVATSITWLVRREELQELEWSAERESKGWQMLTAWLVCLVVFAMWAPFCVFHLLTHLANMEFSSHWWSVATWLVYGCAGVVPIAWMFMPTLRHSLIACCCCCSSKKRKYYDEKDFDDEESLAMIEVKNS